MSEGVPWSCPNCAALPNRHGKMAQAVCDRSSSCMGFICECEFDTEESHGVTYQDPCKNAACYHCGWGGTFPRLPIKLKGWEKKAWDAGWRPPPGWEPTREEPE